MSFNQSLNHQSKHLFSHDRNYSEADVVVQNEEEIEIL